MRTTRRTTHRTTTTVLAGVLATVVLTSCGGGNAYCDGIKDAQQDIGAVSDAQDLTVGDFDTAAKAFDDIAAEAPEEVSAEWQKTADTLAKTSKALKDSGASADSKLLDAATDPAFAEQAQSLQGDLSALTSDMQTISQNVQSECDINLEENGGGS